MRRKKKLAALRRQKDQEQKLMNQAAEKRLLAEARRADRERKERIAAFRRAEWEKECQSRKARPADGPLVAAPCTRRRTALEQY